MPVVRLEALRALARKIEADVPALEGKVLIKPAPSGAEQVWPTLTLIATRWRTVLYQSAEVGRRGGEHTIYEVGEHQAIVQLRLSATTGDERAELEERVINVFLGDSETSPGTVTVPVVACEQLGRWFATYQLDDDEWDDERAFDRVFDSILTARAYIPALVTRQVPTIRDLRLGLADLDSGITAATFGAPSAEVVVINEDGTISPAP